MQDYSQITGFQISITNFQGEGLMVRYDMVKKIVAFEDGYMWDNNFVRSLNDEKYEYLIEKLPETQIIETVRAISKGDDVEMTQTVLPTSWECGIAFADGTKIEASAEKKYPKTWAMVKAMVEYTTGNSFRLR